MKYIEPKHTKKISSINEDCSFAYYSKNPAFRHVFLLRLKESLKLAIPNKHGAILDIGSGCGYLIPSLSQYGPVYCVDYEMKYLKRAEELAQHNNLQPYFINSSGDSLPFKPKSFDVIFCLSVFEHIPDIDRAIDEAYRVLSDHGQLIVGLPVERFLTNTLFKLFGFTKELEHLHVNDFRTVEKKLQKKFKIVKSKKILHNYIPDAFSLYIIYKCQKKRISQ